RWTSLQMQRPSRLPTARRASVQSQRRIDWRDPVAISKLARQALAFKLIDDIDQAAFQRQVALPQSERDRIAPDRLGKPGDLHAQRPGDLTRHQRFGQTGVDASGAQAVGQCLGTSYDFNARLLGLKETAERDAVKAREADIDADFHPLKPARKLRGD